MREIKFRAWDRDYLRWLWEVGEYPMDALLKMDVELEQYTGLKDKNGTEIYEGDILSHYSGLVPAGSNPLVRNVVEWKGNGWTGIMEYRHANVIGNIHENPELLEKKE